MPRALPHRRVMLLFLFACAVIANPAAGDRKEDWVEVRSPHFVVSSDAGEKQARKMANQFEQIRAMFHAEFPSLRVDPGQPILILVAKNENTMKALLPQYWAQKGHVRPAGVYQQGPEKHYVAVQLDVQGENPFHSVYHEYTHALLNLNSRGLPLWLDEGLAEFYGNTALGDKEIKLGQYDPGHLILLRESKLIPIDVLLQVDHSSPLYNEQNRASVFYAESWALVHYLMMDPGARKAQLLNHFQAAFDASGDQLEAARKAFGDLKKFAQLIEGYVRQSSFFFLPKKASTEINEKVFAARALPPAESLALRGDFLVHTGSLDAARPLLEQAVQLDAQLAAAHEGLGYYYYRKQEMEPAAKEFAEAARLDSKSPLAHYFHAFLLMREGSVSEEKAQQVQTSLEKSILLNPNFAPAYVALSTVYLRRSETKQKAVEAALQAAKLEPGRLEYAFSLGQVLLAADRLDEARTLAERLLKAAKTPAELAMAQALQQNISGYQKYAAARKAGALPVEAELEDEQGTAKPESAAETTARSTAAPEPPVTPRSYSMFGRIGDLKCLEDREVELMLSQSGIVMHLHATDAEKLAVTMGEHPSNARANPCAGWKGRMAQISYTLTPGKGFDAEITAISFR